MNTIFVLLNEPMYRFRAFASAQAVFQAILANRQGWRLVGVILGYDSARNMLDILEITQEGLSRKLNWNKIETPQERFNVTFGPIQNNLVEELTPLALRGEVQYIRLMWERGKYDCGEMDWIIKAPLED